MNIKLSYLKKIINEEIQLYFSYKKYQKLSYIFEHTKRNKKLLENQQSQVNQEIIDQLKAYIREDIPYALKNVFPEYIELAKESGLKDYSIVYLTIMDTVSEEMAKVTYNATPNQIELQRKFNDLYRDVENTLAMYHKQAEERAEMGFNSPRHSWTGSKYDAEKPSYDWKKKQTAPPETEAPKGEKTGSMRAPVVTTPPKPKGSGTKVDRPPNPFDPKEDK